VRISQLSDADLQRGLRWTMEQAWLDEKTKELLAEALEKASGGQKGAVS
jgi:adenosine deaminase